VATLPNAVAFEMVFSGGEEAGPLRRQ